MSRTPRIASLLANLAFISALLPALSACGYYLQDDRPLPPPNPPTFCYRTLGRIACYDEPQPGMGPLVNVQLPPVVVAPVVVAPAAAAAVPVVLQPAQPVVVLPPAATVVAPEPATAIDPDAPPTKYIYDPASDTAVVVPPAAPLLTEPAFTDAPVRLAPR